MKKTFVGFVAVLAVVALALPFANAGTKGTWTGWVTDESCGAKGAKAEHKDCALKCIENGGKLVFYNTADEKIYSLDNQATAKEHLGHEVKVTGEAEGTAIKVEKIEMAEANHAGH
ncbi:MAG TPA: DUF5818 domain-containing protein [Thermoanaerobaculia bacterium]|nr:DUF5818 domain-containing protein [Thermoanaerobaculia bacterium]HSN89296.1 DUF5818 domain-containing protein [Thermoanaerobaculia bacterium]